MTAKDSTNTVDDIRVHTVEIELKTCDDVVNYLRNNKGWVMKQLDCYDTSIIPPFIEDYINEGVRWEKFTGFTNLDELARSVRNYFVCWC